MAAIAETVEEIRDAQATITSLRIDVRRLVESMTRDLNDTQNLTGPHPCLTRPFSP